MAQNQNPKPKPKPSPAKQAPKVGPVVAPGPRIELHSRARIKVPHPAIAFMVKWALYLVPLVGILTLLFFAYGARGKSLDFIGLTFDKGLVFAVAAVLVSLAYYKTIDIRYRVMIYVLGVPFCEMRGLIVRFFSVVTYQLFEGWVLEDEFPAEKNLVWSESGEYDPTSGKVEPYRLTFLGLDEETDNPLEQMLVIDKTVFVQWYIVDLWTYLDRIGGDRGEVFKQMEDVARTKLQSFASRYKTYESFVEDWDALQVELTNELSALVEPFGLYVVAGKIPETNPGFHIANAYKELGKAKADKKTTIVNATAERRKLAEHGAGEGEAIAARDKGIKQGFDKIARGGKYDPLEVRRIEVAGKHAENTKNTIVPAASGPGDFYGAAFGVVEALSNRNNPSTPKPKLKPRPKPTPKRRPRRSGSQQDNAGGAS